MDLTSGLIEIHFFFPEISLFFFPVDLTMATMELIPLHESPNRQFLKVAAERGLRTASLATLQPDS